MLGIMIFSVIVWATTAISYPVSAGVIIALMAVLIACCLTLQPVKFSAPPQAWVWVSRAFQPQPSAW